MHAVESPATGAAFVATFKYVSIAGADRGNGSQKATEAKNIKCLINTLRVRKLVWLTERNFYRDTIVQQLVRWQLTRRLIVCL